MPDALQRTGRAVRELYEEHSQTLYRIAFTYLKNRYDAEDALQETFLRLIRSRVAFADAQHEKAWLIRTAVNLCLTDLRAESRHGNLPLDENVATEFGEDTYEVLDAVQTLPTPDRYAVYLYYYEGYGIKDIGHLLKEPEGTVSSRLSRARKKLKALLEGGNHGRQIQQRL